MRQVGKFPSWLSIVMVSAQQEGKNWLDSNVPWKSTTIFVNGGSFWMMINLN